MVSQGSYDSYDSPRRLTPLFAAVTAGLALLIGAAPAAAKGKPKPCKDARLVPKSAKQMVRMQRAIRCLVNAERRKRGRKTLRFNLPLQKASDWQANDMLTYQYFDHTRPDGPTFSERVLRFGYADGADGYLIGENLAWSSASGASPRKIVSLWMHSPPHRHNILTHAFRDQAVSALWSNGGVGGAYASSNGPFVIYVNQFGRRY